MQITHLTFAASLLLAGLVAAEQPGDEDPPPGIAEIESLAQLRKTAPVATLEDWQVRVGLADAGDFAGPWRLLCLHLRYVGKPEGHRDLPQQDRRRLRNRIGPLTWRIVPAGAKDLEYLVRESMVRPKQGNAKAKPVEHLFVEPVCAWRKGRYDVELYGPRGSKLLARTQIRVPHDRHDHWASLTEVDDPEAGTIRIRTSLKRRLPQFTDFLASTWTLRQGQQIDEKQAATVPGQLGPKSYWTDDCYGGERPKGPGPHYPLELEITARALKIRSLVPLRRSPDLYLVRWWIDGVPVTLPIDPVAKELEKKLTKRAERDASLVVSLPWRIPDYIPQLRAGKTLSLQVLYCPRGTRELPRPDYQISKRLFDGCLSPGPVLPLISDAESVKITAEMLQVRRNRQRERD